jgi:microcystin-dependent protein
MDLGSFEQGAAANPPSRPDAPSLGYPSGGDPLVGLAATTPGAYWFYQLQAELEQVLLGAGVTPSDSNLTQLHDAIVALAGGGLSFESLVAELRMDGVAALGVRSTVVRGDHVHPTDSTRAPLASPTFTGVPAVTGAPPPPGTSTTQIATTAFVTTALAAVAATPAGTVAWFAGSTAPTGWLACSGQSLVRAVWPALFAAIGTTYGYADSTHFNLPDLRGEFVRGLDGGRGIDPSRTLGSWQKGTFVAYDAPNDPGVWGAGASLDDTPGRVQLGCDTVNTTDYSGVNFVSLGGATETSITFAPEGLGGGARPRNVALLPIIKY